MQTTKQIVEEISELDDSILFADGFEDALLGYVTIFNNVLALYDEKKCVEILMSSGMSHSEAVEHFNFNVLGAYVGNKTPAFATILR